MFTSLNELGSLVIDVTSNRLDFVFLKTNVTAGDWFTLLKTSLPPAHPPGTPNALAAAAVATNQINLDWNDNSDDEDGFKIERSTNGVNFLPLGTVGANVTNGADSGLLPATAYFYRLRSFNAAGNSSYSEVAQAVFLMFDRTPPAAVTNLLSRPPPSSGLSDGAAMTAIRRASRQDVRYHTTPIAESQHGDAGGRDSLPASAGVLQMLTGMACFELRLLMALKTSRQAPTSIPSSTCPAPDRSNPPAVTRLTACA
jgi:hypothetical protein